MSFPDSDLPDGVGASRECGAWCLEGRQAVAHDVVMRQRFFRRPGPRWDPPPAAVLLSERRGSAEVRMRMVLWLMFAQSFRTGSDGLATSQANWARLVGLPLGARRASSLRRVGTARTALAERRWVDTGRGNLIRLLDPATVGRKPYVAETAEETAERRRQREWFVEHRSEMQARYHPKVWEGDPIRVPAELWANGWVSGLSAKSVVAYMVLLNHRDPDGYSRVPRIRTHQYAVSPDSWTAAIAELARHGLVRTHNAGTVGPIPRFRYQLLEDGLLHEAPKSLFVAQPARRPVTRRP